MSQVTMRSEMCVLSAKAVCIIPTERCVMPDLVNDLVCSGLCLGLGESRLLLKMGTFWHLGQTCKQMQSLLVMTGDYMWQWCQGN